MPFLRSGHQVTLCSDVWDGWMKSELTLTPHSNLKKKLKRKQNAIREKRKKNGAKAEHVQQCCLCVCVYLFLFVPYRSLHRGFFFGSGGSSAAKIASSNTFFNPFCIGFKRTRKYNKNKKQWKLVKEQHLPEVKALPYLCQCWTFNKFHCFQFLG